MWYAMILYNCKILLLKHVENKGKHLRQTKSYMYDNHLKCQNKYIQRYKDKTEMLLHIVHFFYKGVCFFLCNRIRK